MRIDIDKLTEEELLELHNRIVERLRFMETVKAHKTMMQFSVGEKVCFTATSGKIVVATLVKYNKKTVTVITEAGRKWNVSPQFLSRLEEGSASGDGHDRFIPGRGKK